MADNTEELERLQRYAAAANMKVFTSQADLDPKDRPALQMYDWCSEHGFILAMTSGTILTSKPADRTVHNCKNLMRQHGLRIGKVVATSKNLIKTIITSVTKEELEKEQNLPELTEAEQAEISEQQERLRVLVSEAVALDVSDLHIEVRAEVTKVRFRKYGDLYLHAEWFPRVGREVASVAFNKETDHATQHFNPLVPQNASMPLDIEGTFVRLRLASAPAHGGFDVVMRILSIGEVETVPTLEQLGYTKDQIYIIRRAIKMPHGAVLVAGPTGSGKTTTLASCLHMVDRARKIYTVEDPIEKVVEHATQVPVNTDKADRSFASFGRAALRMDPDYIVLGEMRDEDTVTVMIRAALTGHLVLTTVHTNSAIGIVTRLMDMGVTPVMLSDEGLLVCLMFQRLMAVLCPECKVHVSKAKKHEACLERWQAVFQDDYDNVHARREGGCEKCSGTGLKGRVVIAEVVFVDEPGREFILKGDLLGWGKYLKEQGWQDYKDRALTLVREGRSDPFDAEYIVGEISTTFGVRGFDYREIPKLRAEQEKAEAKVAADKAAEESKKAANNSKGAKPDETNDNSGAAA